jgi:hypothetical protein
MQNLQQSAGSIPIVIAVAGHRFLDKAQGRQASVIIREYLLDLLERHPHSEIILLNGLAMGADLLVARIAVELPRVRLVAVLPMPLEEYRRDFSDADQLQEFEKLLELAQYSFVLPLECDGQVIDPRDPPQRSLCYRNLAIYLARYSHFAIALWDGEPSRGDGSTAELVSMVLTGTADPGGTRGSIQEPASAGPVIHISTARQGEKGGKVEVTTLYPNRDRDDEAEDRLYRSTLANIDLYNRDLATLQSRILTSSAESGNLLECPEELSNDNRMLLTRERFHCADCLAVHFKRLHSSALVWLLLLSGIGYTCLELYDEVFSAYSWGSIVLLGFPVALFLAWRRVARSRLWHVKYLNYRALAEGLRIQYYWDIAGISDEVHEFYLNKHQSELRWIRWAVRAWQLPLQASTEAIPAIERMSLDDRLRFVHRTWIFRQSRFFASRAHARGLTISSLSRWRMLLFFCAVAGAVGLTILHGVLYSSGMPPEATATIQSRWILVIAMLFVIGGILSHYAEKVSWSDEQQQYANSHDVFREGSRQIDRLLQEGDLPRIQLLIREIGIEGLQENGDWVKLHKLKSPDLPSS